MADSAVAETKDAGARPAWRGVLDALSPLVASLLLFAAGALILLTEATPQVAERLAFVARLAPLGLIELSHFLGSIVATLMLFVAFGVWRRLAAARRAGIALALAAAGLSLLKGFVWEESALLVFVAALLWATKPAYYRRSRLSAIRPGGWWMAAALAAMGIAAWAGFAAYEHIPYSDDLWWTFLIDGDVSRFLRALTGVAIVAVLLLLWRYAGPMRPAPAGADDEAKAVAIVEAQASRAPDAWLAATGDKAFLFAGASVVMYAPHGDAWIAMGGPVGPAEERSAAIWRFREEADMHNAWPAFYSVGPELLPDLLDAGLAAQKVGETALVDLETFALEGAARAKLRQARARGQRDGFTFAVERAGKGSALMQELREVSDLWLAQHKGAEKGFSLGRFEEDYLARFPIGVLRLEGRVAAFANVWTGGKGGDVAIDLMRTRPDIPRGAMDVVFIELMLWAKGEGYRAFDLGMAPLAGLEDRRLAPRLTRLGAWIYRHGGSFYGFEGLREFKDKFDPRWEPRYLAAPDGWKLSAALGRVALLTAGGIRGMLKG